MLKCGQVHMLGKQLRSATHKRNHVDYREKQNQITSPKMFTIDCTLTFI